MATLLQIITEFTDRRGLDRPGAVIASTDETIVQLRGLLNEVLADCTKRGTSWSQLKKEATFNTTPGGGQQASLAAIAPGFLYVVQDSMWDRTDGRQLFNVMQSTDWQQMQAGLPTAMPLNSFRIWNKMVFLTLDYPAPHQIAFEYASSYVVNDGAATPAWKRWFTADSDVCVLDEELAIAGLNWKFRREKGLSYTQEKLDFEAMLAQDMGTDNKPVLHMDDGNAGSQPGFVVSPGSWPL